MFSKELAKNKKQKLTISAQLADFAISTFLSESMPENIINISILAIIDQYGLQVGGCNFPWSKSIYDFAQQYEKTIGNSTITHYGDLVSPSQAAFINGCFAHAQDFDDSHQEAQTHPGSVVIPAAMAIGEHLELSGKQVLKAIIIGMEVMLRLAHSMCPACIEGGHHTPPTVGPFGAAIACGLLLGLNKEQLINAIGICGSYAGGLVEYTVSGGSVKRIHTGLGARAGLEATLLAKKGLTGPRTIIEGKKGMWAVFGKDKFFPERLLDKIGQKYMLATLMFKPYNCCYLIHPAIQLFLEMCHEHNITHHDIETVTVGMSNFSISHAGTITIPKDELGAQFSTSFTLALSLIKGAPSMRSYTAAVLQDSEIIDLAKRISVIKDETANNEFPKKNGCIIRITTKSGTEFTNRITDPKGSPENLLTEQDVKNKFFDNVESLLDESNAHTFYEILSNFRQLDNVREIGAFFKVKQKVAARL